MNVSLLLRIISLVAVIISGFLFFQIRAQKIRLEGNLTTSRNALQKKLEENAGLKSRALNAEENSKAMTEVAKEEKSRSSSFQNQLEALKRQRDEAESARERAEKNVNELSSTNRDLQRQVNNLQASIPPQNWREQLNQLQSRLLELEAANTSLRKSLSATGQTLTEPADQAPIKPLAQTNRSLPVGEVIRMGPDGSFVILSFGRQLGAAEGQTLTIRRNQQTIALVSLTQITNDFSIAQILSSTNTGSSLSVPDIQIGDSAHLE